MNSLSIDEKKVLMNEVGNDGKTAYLYYSPKYKMFVAYGISAYIVYRMVYNVKTNYESDLQMPMVIVDDSQLSMLKTGLNNIIDIKDEYLQLEADKNYDDSNYDEWAGFLRSHYYGD